MQIHGESCTIILHYLYIYIISWVYLHNNVVGNFEQRELLRTNAQKELEEKDPHLMVI
jgi:hypothetical protein